MDVFVSHTDCQLWLCSTLIFTIIRHKTFMSDYLQWDEDMISDIRGQLILFGWVWAQRNDGNVQGQAVEDVQLPAFNFLPDHSVPQGRPISCGHGRSGAADWSDPQFYGWKDVSLQLKRLKWSEVGQWGGGGRLMYGERETFMLEQKKNVMICSIFCQYNILCGIMFLYTVYTILYML